MSLALARKYRPKNFASVAVQSHVSNTLKGAIARGRVAHGYLLCGPRGTGKTTLARVLAMALNCETLSEERRRAESGEARGAGAGASSAGAGRPTLTREAGEPCGKCASCQRIWSGSSSLDVVEIDAASNRSVDDARELRERAMYAPSGEDRYKVYIVDEAHMLTREAWNALLKILEEPPPRVVFVFATTEPQKIAQTAAPILSRLQRFDLKRIGPAEIRERLAAVLDAEDVAYEPDALGMIARAADGGLRDALSLTDQVLSLGADPNVTAARVAEALGLVPEDEYLAILDLIAERRAGDLFGAVARLADAGVDFSLFLTGLGDVLRALLAVTLGGTPPDVSERTRSALEARRELFAPGDLLRMLHLLVESEPRFRRSGQQQLLLETLLVRFALLDRTVALETVLRGLGEAGGGGGGGSGAPRPEPPRGGGAPAGGGGGASAAGGSGFDRAAFDQIVRESAPARPTAERAPQPAADRVAGSAPSRGAAATLAPPAPAPRFSPPPATSNGRPPAGGATIDVRRLAERWDDVVDHARAARPLVGTALAATLPIGVAASGAVTVELQEVNEAYALALENGRDEVLAAVRTVHPGAARVLVRIPDAPASTGAPERLTTETVKAERVAALTRRDPVLGAAIEALDLDLME